MLDVLYRDARFVVLNKPTGLPVHGGPSKQASVEDAFPSLSRRRTGPWLVHRLDAGTSGCLVVALRRSGLLEAQAAFAAGVVEKTYWAVVNGSLPAAEGIIDKPLLKQTDRVGWRMVVSPAGSSAITAWRAVGVSDSTTWLELRPKTGRTHQLRVHCASLGCPILGDMQYGGGTGPLQLLARQITIPLNPPLTATAPIPPHMMESLGRCGFTRESLR